MKANKKFDASKPVIIFGAAKMGRIFVDLCHKNKLTVIAVCDNDHQKLGSTFEGFPVVNTTILAGSFSPKVQIIIASLSDDEIKKQLKKMGFTNVWSYSFFLSLYPDKFSSLALSSDFDEIFNNKEKILKVAGLLADEKSKLVLLNTLLYRLTLDKSYLEAIQANTKNVYFDSDVIPLSQGETIVDGGAYDGDTLKSFIKVTKGKYSKVLCFEPDEQSLSQLRGYVKTQKLKRIECIALGLGEKRKKVRFTNEGNLQSSINDKGELSIGIVPIDDYIENEITMIKTDIEGYEFQALLGAKRTIRKYHPKLAICAYHIQNDLWEIPLLIYSLSRNYRIYFRHYSPHVFETICYGV